jgi:hypothetical protein
MNKILEKRRILINAEKVVSVAKEVINPNYSLYDATQYAANRQYYPVSPTLRVYAPDTKRYKTSHIEYLIECESCKGTGWVRKITAKYCSPNCRKAAYKERKEAEQQALEAKDKTPIS